MKKSTRTPIDAFSVSQLATSFECDRRTVSAALRDVKPAVVTAIGARYSLASASAALARYMGDRNFLETREARVRQLELRGEKLAEQVAMLRHERIRSAEVEKIGGEAGSAVRKIVCRIHRLAPSIVGLPVAEAEARLKEIEADILKQVDAISERLRSSHA